MNLDGMTRTRADSPGRESASVSLPSDVPVARAPIGTTSATWLRAIVSDMS